MAKKKDVPPKTKKPRRLSDSLFRRTVEDAPLGISVSRGEQILYANKAWRRIFGVPPGTRVVGLSHMVFVAPEEQKRVSRITSARQSGKESPASYDTWVVRADGAHIPLHVSVTPVDLEDGRAELVFLEDISERRQVEERLRWLSRVAEQAGEGVAVADLEGTLTFVNKAWANMHGFEPEELVGQHLSVSHSPDQISRDVLPFNEQVYLKGRHTGEVGHVRRDGTPFPTEMTTTLQLDKEGKIIGLIGFSRDITNRKRADESLRQSEERFRKIFEEGPVGMALTGRDLHFSDANSSFCGMLGYTLEELKTRTFMDITHPDDLAADVQRVQRMLSGELSLYRTEKRYIRKDGGVIWGALTLSSIRDSEGVFQHFLVMVEDVTERKAAEEALKESEERFRILGETTSASIMIFQGSRLRYVNPAWEKLMGYSKAEASEVDFWDLVHPDHREMVRQRALARQRGETGPARFEIKVVAKDGRVIWGDFTGGLVQFFGKPAGLVTAFDITDRKRAEEALQEREKLYRLILENVEEIIWSVDLGQDPLKSRANFMSHQIESVTGYTPEEIVGDPAIWLDSIVHPEDRERVRALTQECVSTGEPLLREYRMRHKVTGEYHWVEDHVVPILDEAGGVVRIQGVARDVTERKKNQAELERRNRELMALVASAQAMTGFLNLEEAARAICKAAVEAFDMRMVWIGLVVPESTELKVLASFGYDEGYTELVKVRWDESQRAQGPTGRAVKTRMAAIMRPEDTEFSPWRKEAIKRGYRTVCALPMIHEETVRGAITFYSEGQDSFGPETLEVLEIFARQATMAVVNAALYGEASGTIDELNSALQELQTSQEALKEREERYRGLVENAKGIMLLWTPDLKVTYWNDYAEEFFGFTKEEILGRSLIGTIVPRWESSGRDLDVLLRRVASDPNAYASNINQNVTRDGRKVWVAWTNRPIVDAEGRAVVILSHGTDITPLKEAELALRESEERYRALVETSPEAIALGDLDANVTMVNKRLLELWGTEDPAEVVGRNVADFIVPEDRHRVPGAIKVILARGLSRGMEYRLLRKDGTSFPAELNVSVLADTEGKLKGMMCVIRDLTREKHAAEVLQRSERLYRTVVESAQDFIFVVGKDEVVQYVNSYAAASLRSDPEQVVGRTLGALFPPPTHAHMIQSLREVFEKKQVINRVNTAAFPGRERVLDTRLIPLQDADGNVIAVMGVSREITDRNDQSGE